mmetsp:Transcript_8542/g.17374  ORF Transcript_8542/g.17374 Transcript_8542/m.17374 type:complete len:521 (-) Transcript_8542:61-1623(-)
MFVVLCLIDRNVLEHFHILAGVWNVTFDLAGCEALDDGNAVAINGAVGSMPETGKVVPYRCIDAKVGRCRWVSPGVFGAVLGPRLLALVRLDVEVLLGRSGLGEGILRWLLGTLIGKSLVGTVVATVRYGSSLKRLRRTGRGGLGEESGGLLSIQFGSNGFVTARVSILVAVDEVEKTRHLIDRNLKGSVKKIPVHNLGTGRGSKTTLVSVGTVHGKAIGVVHVVKVTVEIGRSTGDGGLAQIGLGIVHKSPAFGTKLALEGSLGELAFTVSGGFVLHYLFDHLGLFGINHLSSILFHIPSHGRLFLGGSSLYFLGGSSLYFFGRSVARARGGNISSYLLPTTEIVLKDRVLGTDGDHGSPNGGGYGRLGLNHVDGVELGVEVFAPNGVLRPGMDVKLDGVPGIEGKVGNAHAAKLARGLAKDVDLGSDLDAVVADAVLEIIPRAVAGVKAVVVLGVGVALIGGDLGDGDGRLTVAGNEVGSCTLVSLELERWPTLGAETAEVEVGVERTSAGGVGPLRR